MKKNFKHILFYIVLIVGVILICAALFTEKTEQMKYSDVVHAFKYGQVDEFEINKNNVLTMTFKEDIAKNPDWKWGEKYQYRLASLSIFHADLG